MYSSAHTWYSIMWTNRFIQKPPPGNQGRVILEQQTKEKRHDKYHII